ncbi:MAG: alpha/beta hydrolase [Pirellulales bacterium]
MFRRSTAIVVWLSVALAASVAGAQTSAQESAPSSRRTSPRVQLPKTLGRVADELRAAIPQHRPPQQPSHEPDTAQPQQGTTQRRITDRVREFARTKIHTTPANGALNLTDFGATQPFAFSAESKYLVAAVQGGAGLAVWETDHHRRLMRLENSDRAYALIAVSPQAGWVAAVRQNNPDQIDLWQAGTGRHIRMISAAGGAKRQLDFSSESELTVTAVNGDGLTISIPSGDVTGGSRSATGRAGVRRPRVTIDGSRQAPPTAAAPSVAAPSAPGSSAPMAEPRIAAPRVAEPRMAAPHISAPRSAAPRMAAPRARAARSAPVEEPPLEVEIAEDAPNGPSFAPEAPAPDDSEIAGQNAPPIETDEPTAAAPAEPPTEEMDTSTGAAPWSRSFGAVPPPPPEHSFGAAPPPTRSFQMPAPAAAAPGSAAPETAEPEFAAPESSPAEMAPPGAVTPGGVAPRDWGHSGLGGGDGAPPAPTEEESGEFSSDEPSGGAAPEMSSEDGDEPSFAAPSAPPEDEMGEPAGAAPEEFADEAPSPEVGEAAPEAVIEGPAAARGPFHFEMQAEPETAADGSAGAAAADPNAPPFPVDEPATAAPQAPVAAPFEPTLAAPRAAAPAMPGPTIGAPTAAAPKSVVSTAKAQPAVVEPVTSINIHYATNRNRLAPKDRQWSVYFTGFFTSLPAFILYGVLVLSLLILPWFGKRTWAATAVVVGLAVLASMATFEAYVRSQLRDEMTGELYGCRPTELSYGTCTVSVPRPTNRRPGEVNRPVSVWVLQAPENPDKHFLLKHVEEHADVDAFYRKLALDLDKSEARAAMLFIHGYNVSFEDAVFRTAQLAVDLKFPGAAMSFCWPSYADPVKYTFDEQNAEVSIPALREVLNDLATRSGAKRIHLIAHSMGNRVLAGALETMDAVAAARNQQVFRELVLAAPDIDSRVFRSQVLPHITRNVEHCTLYASSRDRALLMSRFFHNYQRLGETEPELLVAMGIDTIDASLVDTSLLGHSYIGDVQSIVSDLRELVVSGKRPVERLGLELLEHNALKYWLIKPALQSATTTPWRR